MESVCFSPGGMWIFPIICFFMMFFCVVMMFIGRNRFGSGCFPFSHHWRRDYDKFSKEGNRQESALEILNKRYANGEITKEEFERIKKDILS